MNVILKISLRNLVRQKRRNLLLGIGIAFGMCILIIANAFSHGISDILLNKIIINITGHITVTRSEKDEKERGIIRDKEKIQQIIVENVEGLKEVRENIGTFGRALGNGTAEFIVLVGVEPDEAFYQEVETVAGDLQDLTNSDIENPVALYDRMAEDLNVQLKDVIKVKFQTVYGQVQTARLNVIAIMKSGNPFMNVAAFSHINTLKPLMGIEDHETARFSVTLEHLKNPRLVLKQANRLHAALQPGVAGYKGTIQTNEREQKATILAVAPDEEARQGFASFLRIVEGDLDDALGNEDVVVLSQSLADELRVNVGDQVASMYETRFEGISPQITHRVGAIFQANDAIEKDMMFLHANQFYKTYYPSPPQHIAQLDPESPLFPLLLKEWMLLERSPDQKALEKKHKELDASGWRGATLDVRTMYEVASEVLKMERVLDVVTMVAVLILFFIILIGVVNTLRMTIRERTREIGTIRAIGMQRSDVRWSFVTEVLFLTFFASIVGIILAFISMKLLGFITFHSDESFFMVFLVNNHLHFVPTLADIVKNLVIISLIAFITAYIPAGKAAKMSVAQALRHYE